MRERRQFVRFKVSELQGFTAHIDRNRKNERIVTLSNGGCGFYGFDKSWPLNPQKRLFCVFELKGVTKTPIEIQGSIVYTKPVIMDGREVVFYGIEFVESQRTLLDPIIQKLEILSDEGKIAPAH